MKKKIIAICLVMILCLCAGCSSLNKTIVDAEAKQTDLGKDIADLRERVQESKKKIEEINEDLDSIDDSLDSSTSDTEQENDGVALIDNLDFTLSYTFSYLNNSDINNNYYNMFFNVKNNRDTMLYGDVKGINIDGYDCEAWGIVRVEPFSVGKMMIIADYKSLLEPNTFNGTFVVSFENDLDNKTEYEFSYNKN